MKSVDEMLNNANVNICKNISRFDDSDRGLLSQNILANLRNLVEYSCIKIHFVHLGITKLETDGKIIAQNNAARNYVFKQDKYKFLREFHELLQLSASHYTFDEEVSERLMLKYYQKMLELKHLLKEEFNITILENISDFPLKLSPSSVEYYSQIAEKIDSTTNAYYSTNYSERYYIQKVKPFFIDNKVYYEITFSTALNNTNKFDRIIAFSKIDIPQNYAVKIKVKESNINVLDKLLPILIIEDFFISIRPCEFENFSEIFGPRIKCNTGSKEYQQLMNYIKNNGINLTDLVLLDKDQYMEAKNYILSNTKSMTIFEVLDKARYIIQNQESASNILRYLLYKMNNKIIKSQLCSTKCYFLSNLYLHQGCGVFESIPLNSSLLNHNPLFRDLLECIDVKGHEDEIFARRITANIEKKGILYTKANELGTEFDIDLMINRYNSKIYSKHNKRQIYKEHDNIFIKRYEDDLLSILTQLLAMSSEKVIGYKNSVQSWLLNSNHGIDCVDKKNFMIKMFENSKVALIYGSAGTGKTTMVNYISDFFNSKNKLYLANTNAAINNLKRKVSAGNSEFMTIAKYIKKSNNSSAYVLFIDECSTVSNKDMVAILKKSNVELLILVGDTYQIESIEYGNWFYLIREFIKRSAVFELTKPYRSNDNNLLMLWSKVRKKSYDVLELMTRNGYTVRLNQDIWERKYDDEIILCLNYDGLYGINNLNRFLQSSNPNNEVFFGGANYKIGDPILFNESERFAPIIYNNLKGKIVNIELEDTKIYFTIEVYKSINSLDVRMLDLELIETSIDGKSIVRFNVNKHMSTDEDDMSASKSIVPFQIAYAVSIHKSQGLEYDSVKIVITEEVGEKISHNIFYTAITRAKNHLEIFWSPETEKSVLENFKQKRPGSEKSIMEQKLKHLKKINCVQKSL